MVENRLQPKTKVYIIGRSEPCVTINPETNVPKPVPLLKRTKGQQMTRKIRRLAQISEVLKLKKILKPKSLLTRREMQKDRNPHVVAYQSNWSIATSRNWRTNKEN